MTDATTRAARRTTTGRTPHARLCDAGTDLTEAFPNATLDHDDGGTDPDAPEKWVSITGDFDRIVVSAIANDHNLTVSFDGDKAELRP